MATGQQWRHGWIPLTPAAALQKNHGSKPGSDSKLAAQMDAAIRDKAKGRRSRSSTPKPAAAKPAAKAPASSVGNDLDDAAAAIKAGNPARAVNLLTRAMGNAKTPAEKKAIKVQRDALAKKLMGR